MSVTRVLDRVLKSLAVTAVIGGTILIGGTAAHAAEGDPTPRTTAALSAPATTSDDGQQGNDPWDVPPPKNDPWDGEPKGNDPWDSSPHGNDPWD
ncbi:hypothetical protein OG875_01625 [Streptomyces sp. NBC_01498]|uniref:hypothetical protein n=1 Tax=Streptomyces sp. NBC_01498 TaxID=2975870 RepID=UPI002E7C1AE3|nr:hypothetical protein [Streptomyces sp. NBC_01498]WTL23412.1 hypothetical protein OG875_01625 [Streptomyces sp. NBC_01498]